jgi:hypothetical protein
MDDRGENSVTIFYVTAHWQILMAQNLKQSMCEIKNFTLWCFIIVIHAAIIFTYFDWQKSIKPYIIDKKQKLL